MFSNTLRQIKTPAYDFSGSIIAGPAKLKNKTLLIPSWDKHVGKLLEAVLQNAGIDAHLVKSSYESITQSLKYNTGQCLPLNIIMQDSMDYIVENKLKPADTVIWVLDSNLSCNLSMFPHYMKKLLNDHGDGMEQASVYLGDIIFYDISLQTAINAYLAYMFSGYIRKMGCMIRPYELRKGNTDKVIEKSMSLLYDAFRAGSPKEPIVQKIVNEFRAIGIKESNRPKVAIFGDLYVRDNDLMNQSLIQTIEKNGGEVITTSYSDYIKIVIGPVIDRTYKEGHYLEYVKQMFLKSLVPLVENKFNKYFYIITGAPVVAGNTDTDAWLDKFGLNLFHRGESLENTS